MEKVKLKLTFDPVLHKCGLRITEMDEKLRGEGTLFTDLRHNLTIRSVNMPEIDPIGRIIYLRGCNGYYDNDFSLSSGDIDFILDVENAVRRFNDGEI